MKSNNVLNSFLGFGFVWFILNRKNPNDIMRTSYLGTANERGIRNNNPLNIKFSKTRAYVGKIPIERNTDQGQMHEQFESLIFGIAAAIEHMSKRYINGSGWTVKNCVGASFTSPFNTLRIIANVWAPRGCDPSPKMPNGNNPDDYISFVSKKVGIQPDTVLTTSDRETLKKLIWAMSLFENGVKYEKDILSWSNWSIYFNVAYSIANPQ